MDNIFPSSSFTLQLNDDDYFEPFDPSFVFQQQHSLPPLLNPDVPLAAEAEAGRRRKGKKQLPESPAAGNGGVGGDSNAKGDKQRKADHREIERRRRQEMATLYASLRNELPLEYLRGKRSISDHVREAVRYIEQKQKSIRELEAKRDKLKRDVISDPNKVRIISTRSEDTSPSIMVKIQSSREGVVEILINCGPSKLGFGVSCVLELLHEEGLDAVSCFCCRVEGNLLYSIQAEGSQETSVDLQMLRQKVTHRITINITNNLIP
ncbi:PREDICTED: transcription factor bHLH120-like [Ipomoea nil]|uniref:transcription factor bHLH120-like n=1 Tax=Ipomoea nil TaxID=35883 RepID=UPI000901F945|nr:PREDICTED: transcription factor bHLH120-like [Ipomoea nil]